MEPNAPAMDDSRIQRLLEQFAVDPSDTPAFRTLEEHLFFVEAWQQLAGVYECRISATPDADPERERLLLRLATVLEERLADVDGARQRLEELLRQNSKHAEDLASLRRLHTRAGELTAALQLAEIEERLPLRALDRAKVLAEIGSLWNRAGDPTEAERRLEEALQLDPSCDLALEERANSAADLGRNEEALQLHAIRVKSLVGAARCDVLGQMVELLPPAQKERIGTLLREIVRQFPDRPDPIRRLIEIESEAREYERVDELQRALWKALRDPAERVRLALEASALQLREAADLGAAFYWADLADEVAPGDIDVQELRARLFRRTGQGENLIVTLEKLVRIDGPTQMRLLELAVLQEREGRPELATEWLQLLLEQNPGDGEALQALDRCLVTLGRHGERARLLERRAQDAKSPGEAADLLCELADLCIGPLEDLPAGEDAYRRALERVDHSAAAEGLRQLLAKGERFADLARFLEQLAGRETRSKVRAELLTELGEIRLKSLVDASGAREAFSRALDADPEARSALQGLRNVADDNGDSGALLEACQREVEPEPDPAQQIALLRELVDVARSAEQLPRARRAAQAWTELEASRESLEALADIGRSMNDESCERGALEAVLADEPEARARVLARLGELALELADPNALGVACHWYREALVQAPDEAVRSKLIELYRAGGQLAELAHELRARLETLAGQEAIPCRIELAEALRQLGELSAAIEILWPAFEDDPGHPDIAESLEVLLREQGRDEQLSEVLGRRLSAEREPTRRRGVAQKLAELLLDGQGRAPDAVAVLREVADPSRNESLEALFERALEASSVRGERESWLRSRTAHVDAPQQVELLLQLSAIQAEDGRRDEAIETIRRAHRLPAGAALESVQSRLLGLLRGHRSSREQLDLLGELLEETEEPAPRAAFLIERAHIQADDLDAPDRAIEELEQAQQEAALSADELGVVSNLYARTGAVVQQASALGALAELTEDRDERRRTLLRLAALRLDGPSAARDRDEAEVGLRQVLELDPADREAFDRLLALYDEDLRGADVCKLLEARLALPELRTSERSSLALRLATLQMELGQPETAAETVRTARAAGIDRAALNELLFAALEAGGEAEDSAELSEERARVESGTERARWLKRWLDTHAIDGDSARERLERVNELLAERPSDAELIALRLPLLRELGLLTELAEALEDIVSGRSPLPDGRRSVCLRELLQLYEGALSLPERALEWIESEVETEPSLRLRGADLARNLGQPAREAALLGPLVQSDGPATPDCVRRLGLALWQSEDPGAAEQLLWRALDNDPKDREALEALQALTEERADPVSLLRVLDARFSLESGATRKTVAREGLELAAREGQSPLELRWLRRVQFLEPLAIKERARWLELERELGDRPGILLALKALCQTALSPLEVSELLATEADIHVECGQLGLAREGYTEAIRISANPPVAWLQALEVILKSRGQLSERAELLHQLSTHPDLSPEEQRVWLEGRFALLTSHPELCEAAAVELRSLASSTETDPALRIERMRQLLGVYEELERSADWCELGAELVPLLPEDERRDLQRQVATRLAQPLCDVERATAAWESLLSELPEDTEALEALASLLRRPSTEARLAEVLERWADCGAPEPAACWLEAAELRWRELRDASGALADADRALEIDATLELAHALRSELCAHLDRVEDEATSLEALIEADPKNPQAAEWWLRLAQIAAREPRGRERAEEAVDRVLELGTTTMAQRTGLRAVLERLGDWSRAADLHHTEIDAAEPADKPDLLRRLARVSWDELHHGEDTASALAALSEHTALDAQEHERWAEALASLGSWPETIAQRRAALEAAGMQTTTRDWLELAQQILEKLDDLSQACEACERALALESDDVEALRLRATLATRLDDPLGELEIRERLVALLVDERAAARSSARAGDLVREHSGDVGRAMNLYRLALRRDPSLLTALLGAGELALELGEWAGAERRLGNACSLLPESELCDRLADTALGAATAAAQLQRHAEAFRYLELSLQQQPEHPGALDAMTELSLRLGSYERALDCLRARLDTGALEPDTRADRLVQLAQAYEGVGRREEAANTLEEVLAIRPQDEITRARTVDLLEQLGETERAIAQVEDWIERSASEFVPRLELRAARLERTLERRTEARRRLERVVEADDPPAAAWVDLAELTLADLEPERVLAVARRGLDRVETLSDRAALLWTETRALEALEREDETAEAAMETLTLYPGNVACAELLAGKLSAPIDRERAVREIERSLDTGNASPAAEAALWEAIGRAYSGPLQAIERAQLCYRRALECNPHRSSTTEVLADTAALDPSSHHESIHMHRKLLDEFPARLGSWNAMRLIGAHWKRERSESTSELVLRALGVRSDEFGSKRARPLVDAGPPAQAELRAASLLLRTLAGRGSEEPAPRSDDAELPEELRRELTKIAGPLWNLPDETLAQVWREPLGEDRDPANRLTRRTRRRLRRVLDAVELDALHSVETASWRAEVLAEAAARTLERGHLDLDDLLHVLLGVWPATRHLETKPADNSGAVIQICPPARRLLLRIATATLDGLGLS